MEAAALLCADVCCVLDSDLVALGYAVCTLECKGAYGPVIFDHLAADGAGLTGGQVAVVTVLQVDTNLPWCHFYILNPKIWGFQGGSGVIFVVFGRV